MGEGQRKRPTTRRHPGAGQEQVQDDQHRQPYPTRRTRVKAWIAAAGARGFIPPRLAEALIQWGGLRHE